MTVETMTTTLGALLTHSTGILLEEIDIAWDFQDFVVGYPLMTHQRVHPENNIRMQVLSAYPQLMSMNPPTINSETDGRLWVELVSEETGIPLVIKWERVSS